jgi:hypothetical protein
VVDFVQDEQRAGSLSLSQMRVKRIRVAQRLVGDHDASLSPPLDRGVRFQFYMALSDQLLSPLRFSQQG